MTFCMLTTVHKVKDHRIYYKEGLTLSKYYNMIIIALGEENKIQVENNIKLIEYKGKLTPTHHLLNCFNCFKTALKHKSEIYHCHEPSSLFIGCILKILYNSKLIYDRHDYYPTLIKEKFDQMGLNFISPLIYNIEKIAEKLMIKFFVDKMVVPDEEMQKSYKNATIIHNYPTKMKGKIRTGCNFVYLGILDKRKIPESIKIINEIAKIYPQTNYKIAGLVFGKSLIPKNTKIINYCGNIPHSEINNFLNDASFGICLYEKSQRYENAVSTKTYEYITSGIPIIASKTKGNQFIEDNNYGILIDPDNFEESVEIIKNTIPKCEEFSKNCLKTKYKFESEKLLNLYKNMK